MSFEDAADEELAYLWTKVKFIQRYMKKNEGVSFEAAEQQFHTWIEGLMESRIENMNRMLNAGGTGLRALSAQSTNAR